MVTLNNLHYILSELKKAARLAQVKEKQNKILVQRILVSFIFGPSTNIPSLRRIMFQAVAKLANERFFVPRILLQNNLFDIDSVKVQFGRYKKSFKTLSHGMCKSHYSYCCGVKVLPTLATMCCFARQSLWSINTCCVAVGFVGKSFDRKPWRWPQVPQLFVSLPKLS